MSYSKTQVLALMQGKLDRHTAVALAESGWWKSGEFTKREIACLQMEQPLLCMDFGDFHQAVEEALGRSVWTHEFADAERIKTELYGGTDQPSFEDIINQIPEEKRIIVRLQPEDE